VSLKPSQLEQNRACALDRIVNQWNSEYLQLHEDGVAKRPAPAHERTRYSHWMPSDTMCRNVERTSSCMKTGSPSAARPRMSAMPELGSSNTTGPLPRALPSAMATARPARLSPAGDMHFSTCSVRRYMGSSNTTGPSPGALPSAMATAHPAGISPEVGFRV